jgi:tetratricopeptide (TPR) repeat protein
VSARVVEIDALVRARRMARAARAIAEYAREEAHDPQAIIRACDWYRRLGLFRAGFLLVASALDAPTRAEPDTVEGRKLLWAARFMNLMGAGAFAVELVSRFTRHTPESRWISGNIFLVNYRHAEAYEQLRLLQADFGSLPEYARELSRLSLADAAAGCGRAAEAIALATEVLGRAKPGLARGIALQARAEYRLAEGDAAGALADLAEATPCFDFDDESPDFGVFLKWRGYARGLAGRLDEARADLERALGILRRPGMRPEAWLEVLRLREKLGLLDARDRRVLHAYPGLAAGFGRQLGSAPERESPRRTPRIEIQLGAAESDAEEARLGGERFLGLSKELRLLAWIRETGRHGLHAEIAKTLLWPGEAFSYAKMDDRLQKLLGRIRSDLGAAVEVRKGTILLVARSSAEIGVRIAARPSFLSHAVAPFSGGEVSRYYTVSKSRRAGHLADWEKRGWISRSGAGPRWVYRVR